MMKTGIFQLSGGDGGAYGPSFGPVDAVGIGEIEAPGDEKYLVVELREPVTAGEMEVSHCIIAPRYIGATFESLGEEDCAVAVAIVFPGKLDDVMAHGMSGTNSKYWAIGKCKRLQERNTPHRPTR